MENNRGGAVDLVVLSLHGREVDVEERAAAPGGSLEGEPSNVR